VDSVAILRCNEGTSTVQWYATDICAHVVSCKYNVVVNAKADLVITKTATVMQGANGLGIAGQELIYILTVTNNGPAAAHNVVITDNVSAFWPTAYYATTNTPYNWAAWSSPYQYSVGNLAKDASATIYIKGMFAINQCEDITNTATVSSTNDDNPANNTANLLTIILDQTPPEIITCPANLVEENAIEGCSTGDIEDATGFAYSETEVSLLNLSDFPGYPSSATDNCGIVYISYIDVITEKYQKDRHYNTKEVGEGYVSGTVAAVANAVYNATGVRLKQTPFSPDRVLNGLEQTAKRKEG